MKPIWNNVAKGLGYSSMKQLLEDRYVTKSQSKEVIALDLECDRTTIARLLLDLDVKRVAREPVELTKHEAVNLTVGQIARKYNITKSTSWRLRKKLLE